MANAAFFLGLMAALPDAYRDVSRQMPFDEAKDNFLAAARQGLRAQFTWLDGKSLPASTLVLEHLLPLAREGLQAARIETEDIDRYLGILEERVRRQQTGSQWTLRSLAEMGNEGTREQRLHALAASMLEGEQSGHPVHEWPTARLSSRHDWRRNFQTVGQFMSTDLFTVRPDDLVELAANVMNWKHVRHVPVEDDEGRLIGIVSHRDLLRLLARELTGSHTAPVTVKEIMISNPLSVSPETPTVEAIRSMRRHNVGCLPVTKDGRLVGILTAQDFLNLSADLIEAHLGQHQSGLNVRKP
jgi:CBS domain-containing protein